MVNIFNELLEKTKDAYERSDIKSFGWYYSISSTPLKKNATLLVGLNWGVSPEGEHEPQPQMPDKPFKEIGDLGSFKRVIPYLDKYLPNDELVQSNFCFFRSKKESQLTQKDFELSTPLFNELVETISPTKIIGFSNKLRDYFLKNTELFQGQEPYSISSNKGTLQIIKGTYSVNGKKIPTYFLPHPNYPISSDARDKAWNYCFGGSK